MLDIELSMSVDEVANRLAEVGVPLGIDRNDVRVGVLPGGGSRRGGLNAVWVQCRSELAEQLVHERRLRLGWSTARVFSLARRRLQCFRCLAVGHARINCAGPINRSDLCFNCGKEGHQSSCRTKPHCPVCFSRGLGAGHRADAAECPFYNGDRGVRVDGADAATDRRAAEEMIVDPLDGEVGVN